MDFSILSEWIATRSAEMVQVQSELTRRPAIGPDNGGEGEWQKAQFLEAYLREHGLGDIEHYDCPDDRVPERSRPNLVVKLPGMKQAPAIWVITHMDVVPPGQRLPDGSWQGWESDPYTLRRAGDMIVGALLGAGLELEALRQVLGTLELDGYSISADKVHRAGLAGTKFDVLVEQAEQPPRGLREVESIIDSGTLPGDSAEHAKAVFRRLAQAEAKVHGQHIEKVHFHEVGAVDAIVDIVGTCIAIDSFSPNEIWHSPLVTGRGTVKCAHGTIPVPAPAVMNLVIGSTLRYLDVDAELTTPTGAASWATRPTRSPPTSKPF